MRRLIQPSLLALLSLAGARLGSQTVAGKVVTRDSTPASGVIVVANDAQGKAVARTLTGMRGEFALRLPAAGRVDLRMLRVGYRPVLGPSVDVAAGPPVQVLLVFSSEAVTLAAINVRERETCRVRADTGLMVARVWEEAQKAMLSTELTVAGAPLFAEWVEYDRTLDSTARLVRDQRVRTSRNPTTHAFKSVPADVLESTGYVVASRGATTYYAPDAEVLLSDAFAAAHCFRLAAPPADRPGAIGVAFQPSRDRREKQEIEGTLWVDRASAELQTLEFRYTNMPDAFESVGAGGRVEFLRFADGNWVVSKWRVRMPQVNAAERQEETSGRVAMMTALPTLRGIQLTGGEVLRVTSRDGVVYQSVGPSVAVQVMARDASLGAKGATLRLDGTDYIGTADASGRLRVSPVLDGRYRAQLSTPLMDSLGLPPVLAEVEARTGARVDSIMLPPSRDLLARACPRDSISHGEGMLYGRVRAAGAARAIDHAAVVVSWQGDAAEKTTGTLSDVTGYWRVCGVPRTTPLVVRMVSDSGSDRRDIRLATDQAFAGVDLASQRDSAGTLRVTGTLVEFGTFDLFGKPVPGATLEVHPSQGPTRTVVTGPSGRALLPDVAPGLLTIRTKRIGSTPGQVTVTVEPGRNTVPIVLSELAPTLAAVRVVGNRRMNGRHDEFDTRHLNRTAELSLTHEDIEKRNPVDIWTLLNGVPSIRITDSDKGVIATSTRSRASTLMAQPTKLNKSTGQFTLDSTQTAGMATKPCFLIVVVDGVVMNPNPDAEAYDLRGLPHPADIYGVEVFAGPESIPPQYGGTGVGKWCGMIAVWTR